MKKFIHYKQHDVMDCGPTCLKMIFKYYGKSISLQKLRDRCEISKEGVSLLGISKCAESFGFRTQGVKLSLNQLKNEVEFPCILHWEQKHFVVLVKILKKKSSNYIYQIADPSKSIIELNENEFKDKWLHNKHSEGVALLLEPTPTFSNEDEEDISEQLGFKILLSYLLKYKKYLLQVILGLILGSMLQLVFPFLTQAIVDVGISNQNLSFIYLIISAQLLLFFGKLSVEFIRSWILLHISSRINISIISDFLIKLMKLPISFFDTKMIGDIMQRINDHERIEIFLTNSTLNILFSLINLLIFGIVLGIYNIKIFFVFLISSIIYLAWIFFFLKRRKKIDYKRFDLLSKNQSKIIQLISGIQEIKLNNSEQSKRWEWERIQAKLFKTNIQNLSLNQYQQAGANFINEGKNILITMLSAIAVINGEITIGAMLAIQYIVGQLSGPIDQLVHFVQITQDAKISLDRLNDIHQQSDEEPISKLFDNSPITSNTLVLSNITFNYPGNQLPVLKDLNLEIPDGKVTAIVGMSGSGKTTLLKLLLKFYEPTFGSIYVGDKRLYNIRNDIWRSKCGVVLQDGYIFSDTISKNIAVSDEFPNMEKLEKAIKIANIEDYISSLPLGLNTIIGTEGIGLSQGQRQRLLIARSVYKSPEFIFLDEATNSLDANNESKINMNLQNFFIGKTVVIVAHRLSTVKNADKIVVLKAGKIIETGTHNQLLSNKSDYYELVKNQLELEV